MSRNPNRQNFGFIRIACATPELKVADCQFNAGEFVGLMHLAEQEKIKFLLGTELLVTSYTAADLFQQQALLEDSLVGLAMIKDATKKVFSGIVAVGAPLAIDDQLFNCAVVMCDGKILGVVPKTYIPNYKEFYERRWFSPAANARCNTISLLGDDVPFGVDLMFTCVEDPRIVIAFEVCEDLFLPVPPSSLHAIHGATIIGNLSSSPELVGKADYRRKLVSNQSARCLCVYAYTSSGVHESTTDLVFGGHRLIAENGAILQESERFERKSALTIADVDVERIQVERLRTGSFGDSVNFLGFKRDYRKIKFSLGVAVNFPPEKLRRFVDPHPFVPRKDSTLSARMYEIFSIQTAGLAKRVQLLGSGGTPLTIGVSGGLDSTLALLAACRTMDLLGLPRDRIHGYTMPGFGTTDRTKNNAISMMQSLGITVKPITDIRSVCLEEMRILGHAPFGIDLQKLYEECAFNQSEVLLRFMEKLKQVKANAQDLVFENVQARMRTSILMNSGFVLGTGDLSEAAKGWCTYNGDHMSMYNVNCSVPKTMVKSIVSWLAQEEFKETIGAILEDILVTEISPELLPAAEGEEISQKTEDVIGPYELSDFYMSNWLRFGYSPQKIFFLARNAQFNVQYSDAELLKWLRVYIERFFSQQYKRSCMPDGPKVGTVSLSPRGDWRMPSDAEAKAWLTWLKKTEQEISPSTKGKKSGARPEELKSSS